jgi:pantoate--beta-alanine ligase
MSSRNRYLGPGERKAAHALYGALLAAERNIRKGERSPGRIRALMMEILGREPLITEVQYAGAYDPSTLDPLGEVEGAALLAVAARLGDVRLIDNLLVKA